MLRPALAAREIRQAGCRSAVPAVRRSPGPRSRSAPRTSRERTHRMVHRTRAVTSGFPSTSCNGPNGGGPGRRSACNGGTWPDGSSSCGGETARDTSSITRDTPTDPGRRKDQEFTGSAGIPARADQGFRFQKGGRPGSFPTWIPEPPRAIHGPLRSGGARGESSTLPIVVGWPKILSALLPRLFPTPHPSLPHRWGGPFGLPPPVWRRAGVGGVAIASDVPEKIATLSP